MSDDLLRRLQNASPEEREWLSVEIVLDSLPADLRQMAWAAAVPHWFDAKILAALRPELKDQAEELYTQLQSLPFVEPFQGRGHNVHELTRRLMLAELWQNCRDEYVLLSRRAAEYYENLSASDPQTRIERIYHLLIAEPEEGAAQVHHQGIIWHDELDYTYTNLIALSQAVKEHAEPGRVTGEGRDWGLFWEGVVAATQHQYTTAIQVYSALLTAESLELRVHVLRLLGDVYVRLSEYAQASENYEAALPLYQTLGDKLGEANCIQSLGDVHIQLSKFAQARKRYKEALTFYRAIGSKLGEANCTLRLGDVHIHLSELPQAQECYEEALSLYRAIEDKLGEANCIQSLGDVHVHLSEHAQARARYEEALLLYRAIEDKLGEANCIQSLGDVYVHISEYEHARARYEEALPLYRAIGDKLGEANCIQSLGGVYVHISGYAQERARYEEALPLYHTKNNELIEIDNTQNLNNTTFKTKNIKQTRHLNIKTTNIRRQMNPTDSDYTHSERELAMATHRKGLIETNQPSDLGGAIDDPQEALARADAPAGTVEAMQGVQDWIAAYTHSERELMLACLVTMATHRKGFAKTNKLSDLGRAIDNRQEILARADAPAGTAEARKLLQGWIAAYNKAKEA